jgi:hypothetical protein
VEVEIIKRMLKYRDIEKEDEKINAIKDDRMDKQKNSYDLWGVEEQVKKGTKSTAIKMEVNYPRVPLPHPGQSYNPSKEDLKHLLSKVVEFNRPLDLPPVSSMTLEVKLFDEEVDDVCDPNEKISNNPAILAEDKLTRKERNKLVYSFYF